MDYITLQNNTVCFKSVYYETVRWFCLKSTLQCITSFPSLIISVGLPVCHSVYLSACLPLCLSICPSVYLSIYLSLFASLPNILLPNTKSFSIVSEHVALISCSLCVTWNDQYDSSIVITSPHFSLLNSNLIIERFETVDCWSSEQQQPRGHEQKRDPCRCKRGM